MSELLVLRGVTASPMDVALSELAVWLGLGVRSGQVSTPPTTGTPAFALSLETAVEWLKEAADAAAIFSQLASLGTSGLLYGPGMGAVQETWLRRLFGESGGRVATVAPSAEARTFSFPPGSRPWTGPLSGQEFVLADEARPGFSTWESPADAKSEWSTLLAVDGRATFLRAERGGLELFVWLTPQIANVQSVLPRSVGLPKLYDQLLPGLVFLKSAFGEAAWHNQRAKSRLIIDDCLLHPKFGFIFYEELLASMKKTNFATTIAYIPWNFRRAEAGTVNLFKQNPRHLAMCVHGCDHTGGEFASRNPTDLAWRSGLGRQRMHELSQQTGLPCDDVMVFPQGKFSPESMRSLREAGYLAAINTETRPHAGDSGEITLGELMLPASTRYHGFPILPRQYPKRTVDFAVDLFLGRAALIVEHHEFLRDGYEAWEAFIRRLNALAPEFCWWGLEDIVADCYLQRFPVPGQAEIRFFARRVLWRNSTPTAVQTRWMKHEPEPSRICEVRLNGQRIAHEIQDGFLRFSSLIDAGAEARVEVIEQDPVAIPKYHPGLKYSAKVLARRGLSELRMAWQTRPSQLPRNRTRPVVSASH